MRIKITRYYQLFGNMFSVYGKVADKNFQNFNYDIYVRIAIYIGLDAYHAWMPFSKGSISLNGWVA
jgi:hypothetical protein